MAASLQAASALQNVPYHEYQHSIFDRNLTYTKGDMASDAGTYVIPTGVGLGVEPKDEVFEFAIRRSYWVRLSIADEVPLSRSIHVAYTPAGVVFEGSYARRYAGSEALGVDRWRSADRTVNG